MTPQHLVAIIARLAAIWLAIIASQLLLNLRYMLSAPPSDGPWAWLVWLSPLIPALAALLLWRFPLQLARCLLPPRRDDVSPTIDPIEAAAAGCLIVGTLAILQAIPGVIGFMAARMFDASQYARTAGAHNIMEFVSSAGQLLFGIVLMVRANAFAATIASLRRA